MVKLSQEIIQALQDSAGEPLRVEAPGAGKSYVIVDADFHRAALEAMEKQKIHESITRGIEDMKAGRGKPIDQAFEDVRQQMGFPKAT